MRATWTVVRRELAARAGDVPLALAAALAGGCLAQGPAGDPPPLAGLLPLALDARGAAALQGLVLAALALAVVRRGFGDPAPDGDWLARLPLRPGRVFAARAGACLAVVLLAASLRPLAARFVWGPTLAPPSEALAAAPAVGLQALVLLGLALLAAGAGRLAWAVLAGLFLLARALDLPDPLVARGPDLALAAWGLAALAGAAAARAGAASPAGGEGAFAGPGGRLLARVAGALTGLLVLGLPVVVARGAADGAQPTARSRPPQAIALTARYRLAGPRRLLDPARPLLERADATAQRVAELLGVEPPAERIDLRLVGPAAAGGAAAVRVGPDLDLRSALVELAAATARQLLARHRAGPTLVGADGAPSSVLGAGLVRHVAWRAADADPFWSRFHAAVIHARRGLEPGELLDLRHLERTRGVDAAPALGEALVTGLVRLEGEAVLGRLLAALAGARSAPRGLPAWREALARAGVDLDAALAAAVVLVEDSVAGDERAEVPLPRLTLVEDPQETDPFGLSRLRLLAIPDADVPPGWRVVARVRYPGLGRDGGPWPGVALGKVREGCYAFTAPGGGFDARPWAQVGLEPLDAQAPFAEPVWEEWSVRR